VNAYPGHFWAPTSTSTFDPNRPYGDRLIGNSGGIGSFILTFSGTAVYGVGMRVSPGGSDPNETFTATITAYNSSNSIIGVSEVVNSGDVGTGVGGVCTAVTDNPTTSICDDAPFLAIWGYGQISYVIVNVSDVAGASGPCTNCGSWLDTLDLDSNPADNPVPEPSLLFLTGGGLGLLSIARLRKTRRSR
jgi:hypothetical protein